MTPRYYAGIGSRQAPPDVLRRMSELAGELASGARGQPYVLRTGGATGADEAFFSGAVPYTDSYQVFLPWPGFNGWHPSASAAFCRPHPRAYQIAAQFHPVWVVLSDGAKSVHARNVHQILGPEPGASAPSSFVVCWTPDGTEGYTTTRTGGTGQAIRIANAYNIPIFNMNCHGWEERLAEKLKEPHA